MSTLPIYVYENGEITKDVLESVTMFFHNASYSEMMFISMSIAVLMTAVTFAIKKDPNEIFKWLMTFLFVPLFLINITTTVQIVNLGDPLWTGGSVSNVPMVVAYPAHLISEISYGVTTVVEDIFHTDDNATYSKTGMIYASKVQRDTQSVTISSGRLRSLWSEYLRNCIRPDILINHKYSWDDFAGSPKIFEFLETHSPSPLRRIVDRDSKGKIDYPTCKEVLPTIKKLFDDESVKQLGTLKIKLGFLGENKAKQSALLENQIAQNSADFTGMSTSSKETLIQNMAINGIRTGLQNSAAHSNATAAQLNYANTKMEIQNEQMWMSLGLMAQKYIPELHSLLFLMILVSPIFVMFLAMLPSMTFKVLTNYVYGYVYLATWPPLFVIINFFMTKTLEMESIDIAKLGGGLTFSNANAIYHQHIYFAAICGWLLSTVPFIAPYIVKGGASIMGSLSMQVAGMINSSSGQAANENTTGNYNLGNTSMDNHNANKTDMRHMMQTHGATMQNTNGTMFKKFDHSQTYNMGDSMSSGAFSMNSQKMMTQSLTHSLSDAHKHTQTAAANYNHATTATAHDLQSLVSSSSATDNYGHSTSNGLSATQQQAVNQMQSAVHDYAKSHNVTDSNAWKFMAEAYGNAETKQNFSILGNGVDAKEGVRGSLGYSYTNDTNNGSNTRDSSSQQKSFNEAVNTLQQSAMNDTTGHQNSKAQQALHNLNHDNQELVSSGLQLNNAATKEQSLANTLQQVSSGSLQVNNNLIPQFQSYLEQNPHSKANVEAIMTGTGEKIGMERQAYFDAFMQEKLNAGDMDIFSGQQQQAFNESPQHFDERTGQSVDTSLSAHNQSEKVAQHGNMNAQNQYYDEYTATKQAEQAQDNINQRGDKINHTHIKSNEPQEPEVKPLPRFSKPDIEGADWRAYMKDEK
ncbi:hypothetical protein HC723_11025 [Vibrio sp. S11_S32]|uniref:conjugal transfer protein TraG N-terminal domain-containing protein n=1 Tax=Vibrio sp. S11_S32 TaxID=2720225 RepID=UPI0016818887|nr:conjugal transfer protein TraG N-terminal domain-containing protein [Vibrio sp. S11_S32]MBD1576961.1 hypothetical protein [Vibrio sp. S11_S32]